MLVMSPSCVAVSYLQNVLNTVSTTRHNIHTDERSCAALPSLKRGQNYTPEQSD